MSFLSRVFGRAERERTGRQRAEADAPADITQASEKDDAVGRESADESGDAGLSGGERRVGRDEQPAEGALRDEQ